jgi:hypothetical protein
MANSEAGASVPLRASELLAYLWRGGQWGYYWHKSQKRTQWMNISAIAPPDQWQDVYWGVHPCGAIPRGQPSHVRGQYAYIGAVNCFFADLDYSQLGGEDAARAYVTGLQDGTLGPSPNVIVRSGGGFHVYYLLDETVSFTNIGTRDATRDYVALLQQKLVLLLGGDPAARDLARVLRVPMSINCKYDPPRRVEMVYADLGSVYSLPDVEAIVSSVRERERESATRTPPTAASAHSWGNVIEVYNRTTRIRDLLAYYGYTICGDRFVRPGKSARDGISGTIQDSTNTCYTFSTNDPAFDSNNTSPSGMGCTLRPFDLLCRLSFGGDARAAVRYLRKEAKK